MLYPNLIFPQKPNRPFFYTNFVSTVDGKVTVTNENSKNYWPIGSELDHQTLVELRAYADLLIHGGTTAVNHKTVESLKKNEFQSLRKELGKTEILPYMIISNHPDKIPSDFLDYPEVEVRAVEDFKKIARELFEKGYKNVLIEGGPHLLGEFIKADLLDEIFLTLAPKIFGNEKDSTLTLVEGFLFPPDKVKNLRLISSQVVGDELFLRYAC